MNPLAAAGLGLSAASALSGLFQRNPYANVEAGQQAALQRGLAAQNQLIAGQASNVRGQSAALALRNAQNNSEQMAGQTRGQMAEMQHQADMARAGWENERFSRVAQGLGQLGSSLAFGGGLAGLPGQDKKGGAQAGISGTKTALGAAAPQAQQPVPAAAAPQVPVAEGIPGVPPGPITGPLSPQGHGYPGQYAPQSPSEAGPTLLPAQAAPQAPAGPFGAQGASLQPNMAGPLQAPPQMPPSPQAEGFRNAMQANTQMVQRQMAQSPYAPQAQVQPPQGMPSMIAQLRSGVDPSAILHALAQAMNPMAASMLVGGGF